MWLLLFGTVFNPTIGDVVSTAAYAKWQKAVQATARPKNPLAKRHKGKGGAQSSALVAAIRGKALQNSALDNLMAKYAPAGKKKGGGDISDAEFEAARARLEAKRRR